MTDRRNIQKAELTLFKAIGSSDLEAVKRAADELDQAGGEPVSVLLRFILENSAESPQGEVALQALASLDSAAAERLSRRNSTIVERPSGRSAKAERKQADPTRKWLISFIVALAILWPAYSVYRFYHPRPAKPPEPEPPWTEQEIESKARAFCQMAVEQRLRDPDSADFPFLESPRVKISYSGEVRVHGYLHANNGLGLAVRVDYLCTLQADEEKRRLAIVDVDLAQR